jgi:hypothetical protein
LKRRKGSTNKARHRENLIYTNLSHRDPGPHVPQAKLYDYTNLFEYVKLLEQREILYLKIQTRQLPWRDDYWFEFFFVFDTRFELIKFNLNS